jgi:phosphopantothenoylcysteine decarboxylase/phosphopantothenate--cysteine ligase
MTATEPNSLQGRRILLIIGGGIAAYKSLDLIRRLRERGVVVRVVMTQAAQEFITPLSAGAIAGEGAYLDLFDARTEFDIGHIRLARDTDVVVVAPATADYRQDGGRAPDDLGTTVLLATDRPVPIAPAMNPHMWMRATSATSLSLRQTASRRPELRRNGGAGRGRRRSHGGAARNRRRRGSTAGTATRGPARRQARARHRRADP